jgi:hypothetical protein
MVATRKCRARRNDGSRLYVARGVVAVGTLLSVCARLPPGQPLGLGPWPAQDAVPGLVSSPSTCFVDSAFVAMRTRACSLPPFQMISAAATRTRWPGSSALHLFFIRRSPLKKSLACCACQRQRKGAFSLYYFLCVSRIANDDVAVSSLSRNNTITRSRISHQRWSRDSRRVLPRFGSLHPCRLRRYYATLLAAATWRAACASGAPRAPGSCGIFEVSASTIVRTQADEGTG